MREVETVCPACGAAFRLTTEDGYVPDQVVCPPCREVELDEMDRINSFEMWGPNGRPDPRRVL